MKSTTNELSRDQRNKTLNQTFPVVAHLHILRILMQLEHYKNSVSNKRFS